MAKSNKGKPEKRSASLTPRQARFCQEYLVDLNATKSAIRAGYSERGASVQGSTLLANPNIAQKISELRQNASQRTDITVDRVLKEFARLAFLDVRKAFDANGNLIPITQLDDDTAAAIAGLEVESIYKGRGANREIVGRLSKVKLADKKGALDSIARHLGMFVDRNEISLRDVEKDAVPQANARAAYEALNRPPKPPDDPS